MIPTMKNAITTSIDAAGRLVVPKAVREQAGLTAGMALAVRCRDGRVEIEPRPRKVRIVRKGRVCVAEPEQPSEPLSEEVVRRTRDGIRSRQAGG